MPPNFTKTRKARTYREWIRTGDLVTFKVVYQETDILISSDRPLAGEAEGAAALHYNEIAAYIRENKLFAASLEPLDGDAEAPPIIKDMLRASRKAGVGPMAGVAGAVAAYVGRDLCPLSGEVIVENGGDIFISSSRDRRMGIYAGDSPLSGKVALRIRASDTPLGVCTSSGTVGHSLSMGKADAALIVSPDAVLADCVATAAGNRVQSRDDLSRAIDLARTTAGVTGAVMIAGDRMAVWGGVELI